MRLKSRKRKKQKAMNKESINIHIYNRLIWLVGRQDKEVLSHLLNVSRYARIIAEKLMEQFPNYGLTQADVEDIEKAACIHDIGKILIPEYLLHKPAQLTSQEFSIIKEHAQRGAKILETAFVFRDKFAEVCIDTARYHHERWGGSGYPEGLKEDEIPLCAQITALADIFDALTKTRSYKEAYPPETAYEMIKRGECGGFSPNLLMSFEACKEELYEKSKRSAKKSHTFKFNTETKGWKEVSEYGYGISLKQAFEYNRERIEHALKGELLSGQTEEGFVYAPCTKEEADLYILCAYDNAVHQCLAANKAGMIIESILKEETLLDDSTIYKKYRDKLLQSLKD